MSAPELFGPYALTEAIARGGMATVHIGQRTDSDTEEGVVAVKRLHPTVASDARIVRMFREEARVSCRVRHAHVARHFGAIACDGELLLVMEYVHGESLARLLGAAIESGRAPSCATAATVVVDALEGLHAAHETRDEQDVSLGIVHRDISPHNLLVKTTGETKVVDFGIAVFAGRSAVTEQGEMKGKLGYMAPEQLVGDPVSRRTDVFAMGVVLWELVFGHRLFFEGSDAALLKRLSSDGWERLEREAAALEYDGVHARLAIIALRALRVDPRERFATAREMADAVRGEVALAPRAEVSAWMSSLCGAELARREALVASLKQTVRASARTRVAEPPNAPSEVHRAAVAPVAEVAPRAAVAEVPTPPPGTPERASGVAPTGVAVRPITRAASHPGLSAEPRTEGKSATGPRTLVYATIAALLAAFGMTFHRLCEVSEPSAPRATTTITTSPGRSSTPSEYSVAVVVPARPQTWDAAVPVTDTPARSAEHHRAHTNRHACDPPYTTDDDGIRHYKPKCL